MRAILVAIVALALSPAAARAQGYEDEADEGTYSTYSADEARLDPSQYPQDPGAVATPAEVPPEQQLFDTFYSELSRWGRWDEDATYGWIWYPLDPDFRPYTDGWWVYTTEGWAFESDEPWAWAVYHYGRWVPMPQGWAWIPGYEWSPAWVSIRASDGFVGWCPLGPDELVYDYMPYGWRWSWSPWVFVEVGGFGRHHHRHEYVEHERARGAFHDARPLPGSHLRNIPNVHHAEPIGVNVSNSPCPRSGHTIGFTVFRPPAAQPGMHPVQRVSYRPTPGGVRPAPAPVQAQPGTAHFAQPGTAHYAEPASPIHPLPPGTTHFPQPQPLGPVQPRPSGSPYYVQPSVGPAPHYAQPAGGPAHLPQSAGTVQAQPVTNTVRPPLTSTSVPAHSAQPVAPSGSNSGHSTSHSSSSPEKK